MLPEWTVKSTLSLMEKHRIGTSILSITSPGTSILNEDLPGATALSRAINESAAGLRDEHPSKLGFFATLPPVTTENMGAVLDEVKHALDVLHADGVTLFTRYGPHYLGHETFRPLWAELDGRKAVVFIHPTHSVGHDTVSPALPQPVIDYPHETTRTAVDLIQQGVVADFPGVKVILSHAGGTLPYLAMRAAHLAADARFSTLPAADFLDRAKSFYFDLALSTNPIQLDLLLAFAKPGHVLYGSDFPYAPEKSIGTFVEALDAYEEKLDKETKLSITRGAALQLFPRLRGADE
jgi:predicted TIM-barrel fold metal-dependent hydrolase